VNEDYHPIFTVKFRLLTAEEGGRHTPIFNGYRPQWKILREDGTSGHHDAMFQSLDKDPLLPGEKSDAEIEPFFPHFWVAVRPGMTIGTFEGAHQVGVAEVLTVPADLHERT
jgi:elongation factor Tu